MMYKILAVALLAFIFNLSVVVHTVKVKLGSFNDLPFFDLTVSLTRNNVSAIKRALEVSPNVLFKTDTLVSKITELVWVVEKLENYQNQTDAPKTPICLMISYRYIKQNYWLDWNHYQDILYSFPNTMAKDMKRIEKLGNHLCGVILDFSATEMDWRDMNYWKTTDISFTSYAKSVVDEIFGIGKIPVGITYMDNTFEYIEPLKEQEIPNADFLVINLDFVPMYEFSLEFRNFDNQIEAALNDTELYLFNVSIKTPVMTMLSYNVPNEEVAGSLRYLRMENKYLAVFQQNVAMRHKNSKRTMFISGTVFDFRETRQTENHNESSQDDRNNGVWPYLYLHEPEVSPCQLKTMVEQISKDYTTLVVNEFSWSALTHIKNLWANASCSNALETNNLSFSKTPLSIILFASEGIGNFWDKRRKIIGHLINTNVSMEPELNLTTVIFSHADLERSIRCCEEVTSRNSYYRKSSQGRAPAFSGSIPQLAEALVDDRVMQVGCATDFGNLYFANSQHIEAKIHEMEIQCRPILSSSKVLVWQYTISNVTVPETKVGKINRVMRQLMNMRYGREIMQRRHPRKEIVFQIVTEAESRGKIEEDYCKDKNKSNQDSDLYLEILAWGKLFDIKIIFGPAFNMKRPGNALYMIPEKDGRLRGFDCH